VSSAKAAAPATASTVNQGRELDQLGGSIRSCATLDQPKNLPARPIYIIRLRPEPGVDAPRAVRHLLKRALRSYGLRCVAPLDVEGAP
jgi:hypothetical protein